MKLLLILLTLFLTCYNKMLAQASPPQNGLIANYPFNGNANNVTGNGNNGVVNGASLTTDRFGNPNSAYQFDGVNDYIEVVNDFNLPEKSIVLWFNAPIINSQFRTLFNSDHISQTYGLTALWLILNPQNNKSIYVNQGGGFNNYPVKENQWYMITVTKTLIATKFYINDVLVYDAPTFSSSSGNGFSGTRIGTSRLLDRFFEGKIDDVLIYNRAISQCEIAEIYGADLNTGLVANYPFNGNSTDVTGNGNNGAVNGALLTTDRFGNANSAYQFDGIDDFIDLNTPFDFPERTINLWVNVNAINSPEPHIYISDNSSINNGFTQFKTLINAGQSQLATSACVPNGIIFNNINLNSWYMLTLSVGFTSVNHYLNGNLIQTTALGTASSINGHSTALLGTSRLFDRFFSGKIDDVRIYNRRLSDCDIAKLYDPNTNPQVDTTLYACSNDSLPLTSDLTNTVWLQNGNQIASGSTYLASGATNGVIIAEGLNACGCVQRNTFRIITTTIGSDTTIFTCQNSPVLLNTNLSNSVWKENGNQIVSGSRFIVNSTSNSIFTASGLNNSGCIQSDTFRIQTNPLPQYTLPDNTILCENIFEPLPFELTSPAIVEWSENSLFQDPFSVFPVVNPIANNTNSLKRIKVFVEITSSLNGCSTVDSIELVILSDGCKKDELLIKVPNVVTANGDGYNDKFYIENLDLYPENELSIYNRSGRPILNTSQYDNDWPYDEISSGVYFYRLFIGEEFNQEVKGFIHILR